MYGQGISAVRWYANNTESYLSMQVLTKSSSMPPGPGSITLINHQGEVPHYLVNVLFKWCLFSIFMLFLGTQEYICFTITVDWGNRYQSLYHYVCLEPMKSLVFPCRSRWGLSRKQGNATVFNTFTWCFALWTSSQGSFVWDSVISTCSWISPPSFLFLYLRIIFLSCSFSWCFPLNRVCGQGVLSVFLGPGFLTLERQENRPVPLHSVTSSCPQGKENRPAHRPAFEEAQHEAMTLPCQRDYRPLSFISTTRFQSSLNVHHISFRPYFRW